MKHIMHKVPAWCSKSMASALLWNAEMVRQNSPALAAMDMSAVAPGPGEGKENAGTPDAATPAADTRKAEATAPGEPSACWTGAGISACLQLMIQL